MTERIVVFIDYQNVYLTGCDVYAAGEARHRHVPHPGRLGDAIAAARRRPSVLAEVRVHRGMPVADFEPRFYAVSRAQQAEWEQDARVRTLTRSMRYPSWSVDRATGLVRRGDPPQEKGVDVALAVDVLLTAASRHAEFDAFVVVSDDSNLLPALEAFRNRALGHLEVASWSMYRRLRFPMSHLPYCHYLSRQTWESVCDDWTGRP